MISDNIPIRYAKKEDNSELIRILKNYPISSTGLSYKVDRSPDYFQLCRIQGNDYRIIIAGKNQIIGTMSVIADKVYLEKEIRNITYTADLRVEPAARGSGLADKIMEKGVFSCREIAGKDVPIFTVVMKSNKAGLKKNLNLGRNNITDMHQVAEVFTYFFLPYKLRKIRTDKKYFIVQAHENDMDLMFDLWGNINSKKSLTKFYSREEFKNWINNTEGLTINNYLLLKDERNNLKGFMGIWNQSRIRKIIVTEIPFYTRIFSRIWNFFAVLLKLSPFPGLNQELNFHNIINLCVAQEDAEALPLLIESAFNIIRKDKSLFLGLALDKKDPLNYYLDSFIAAKSELLLLSNYNLQSSQKDELYHLEISLG